MSILIKPYEITVWDDVWNPTLLKFEEKRIGIIGSNDMSYQGRAIEPNLMRNVNGTKKFSFKMYRYFVDNETGEKVENPFINWLVSERKVKLHYKNKWYDFIVKNIVENSSNYLYTYQLEDALVLELSKNGFGVTLDTKLMNNMGTAEELAKYVLAETDWNVKAEAFVEQVEDNLVYVTMPTDLSALNIYRIRDQVIVSGADNEDGTEEILLTDTTDIKKSDLSGKEILAFYTSCTNKPNRFQFIYIPEGYYKENDKGKRIPSVPVDKNQIINVKDCQYYCEINKPELDGEYVKSESFPQFYLPKNFTVFDKGQSGISNSHDTTISVWYRGKRYGFAQSAKYIPLLDRYCNEYTKETTKYYGFVDNDYASPALSQNMVTNTEFKGTTGWVGTYSGSTHNAKADFGAEVEAVYGRFNNNNFSSVVDELSNGTYDSDNDDYTAYLKVTFPANGSADKAILLNTGFYDNRTLIKQVDYDEEWYFNADIVNGSGAAVEDVFDKFDFKLREVTFDPVSDSYILGSIWAEHASKTIDEETVHLLKFNIESKKDTSGYADVKISEKDFKKKEIKLVITPKVNSEKTTYYIKNMQLFKLILNDESKIIKPGDIDTEGVVKTTYRFFPAAYVQEIEGSSITVVTDAENISYENFDKTEVDYSAYKPKYNAGAQKVRSVDAKESNYFNILQKIAETFEIWLDLEIERDALGGIISKTAKFKNYVGKDNHAAFRYGVNLKDIQRTYESKNIVTKLIVKQNSNEHAKNGFCTIARAGSNQTGENYIYDFRYFHDRDMLDATDYVSSLYYSQNPLQPEGSTTVEQGPDLGEGHESEQYNLQNYFNRVKNLNTKIENINETIIPLTTELTKYKAELEVQLGLRDAASEGVDQVREDFAVLTGLTPETIAESDFSKIECEIPGVDDEATVDSGAGVNKINSASWAENATITATQVGATNSTKWKFNIALADSPTILSQKNDATSVNNEGGYCLVPYSANENQFKTVWDSSNKKLTTTGHNGLKVYHKYQQNKIYKLEYDLKCESGTLSTIGGHNIPFSNCTLSYCVDGTGLWSTPSTNASVAISTEDSQKTIHIKQIGTFNCPSLQSAAYYDTNCFCIQPNKPQGSETLSTVTCIISNVKLSEYGINTSSKERTIYIQPTFTLTPVQGNPVIKTPKIPCTIPAYSNTGTKEYSLTIVDTTASSISSLLTEYATYLSQYNESKLKAGYKTADGNEVKGSLQTIVEIKEKEIENKQQEINTLLEYKKALNQLFYSRYSRFIQEGTWMDEKYIDDDKYYADAQSVMYNSCYPQVAYNINVIALDVLPEYEGFDFELGDKTYAIDPEFFGEDYQEEVIINEMSTNLDDPTKDQIKVQNFKNQFQDLFQKITATVQQAQYSTGSYEKAVALAEANAAIKSEFLNDALSSANSRLSAAGQTTVVQGADGITLTDEATKDQMRLIGGAILMSVEDENGQRKWKTGLTPDGISASLVTAGTINTGNISIMNGKDATFMWNAYGLSAFDVDWTSGEITGTPKKNKFVRFDKYGIYGINDNGAGGIDGTTWKPTSNDEVDDKATFALTWEGLKVTGNDGVIARIGKQSWGPEEKQTKGIIRITKDNNNIFSIDDDGNAEFSGTITASTFKNEDKTVYLSTTGLNNITIGNETINNLLLRIGNNFGVDKNGQIFANTGKIGSWMLDSVKMYSFGSGMAVNTGIPADPAFWAGYSGEGNTPWNDENWSNKTQFYVTNEGSLYTKDIHATGGEIAGFTITAEGFSCEHESKTGGKIELTSNWGDGTLSIWRNKSSDKATYLGGGYLVLNYINPYIELVDGGGQTIYVRSTGLTFRSSQYPADNGYGITYNTLFGLPTRVSNLEDKVIELQGKLGI